MFNIINVNKATMRYRKYTLFSLFVTIAIDTISVGLLWPLLPTLFLNPNTSILSAETTVFLRNFLYSLTIAICPLCTFFGSPILGDLSDRIGRKKMLVICLIGTFFGYGLCLLGVVLRAAYLLVIGRAIIGFCVGSQAISQAVIMDLSQPNRKAANLAIISVANNMGFILGPLFGMFLAKSNFFFEFSIYTPFTVVLLISMLNTFILQFIFQETYFPKSIKRISLMKSIRVFSYAFLNKKLRLLTCIYFFAQLSLSLYLQYSVVNFVQHHAYSENKLSYFLSAYFMIFSVSLLFVMPRLLRIIKLETLIGYTLTCTGLSFLINIIDHEWLLWINMTMSTGCAAITYNGLLTLISNVTTRDSQGKSMGIAGSIQAVCSSLGALLAGGLVNFSSTFPFILSASCVFLSLLLTRFYFNPSRLSLGILQEE